jgi:hypothetical protein
VILTSNLGVREAEGALGFGAADDPRAFVRAAERFFRPEFFNRLDRVVPFGKLSRGDLGRVARRVVDGVLGRAGFAQRGCVLDVTPGVIDRVIDAGYDPALGARAMKRAVEHELTRPAAAALARIAPDELTIVTVRSAAGGLAVDVHAPGWAPRVTALEPPPAADRIAAARAALERVGETLTSLRPAAGVVSGRVTAAQERYFSLREMVRAIAADLDRIEERADPGRTAYVGTRQPEAIGRRSRYRAIKVNRDRNRHTWHDASQPFRSLLSAVAMEEAVRELLEHAEPADPDADLFELENRLALLALTAAAPADDRPTYLWVRGFPGGAPDSGSTDPVAEAYHAGWAAGLDVELTEIDPPGLPSADRLIQVKGVHARPLARTEVGTHLVLPKHGGPVPVRVDVTDRWPAGLPDPLAFGPVLRVYPAGRPILDVRTGLVAPPPYAPDLLRAFTLAALPRG